MIFEVVSLELDFYSLPYYATSPKERASASRDPRLKEPEAYRCPVFKFTPHRTLASLPAPDRLPKPYPVPPHIAACPNLQVRFEFDNWLERLNADAPRAESVASQSVRETRSPFDIALEEVNRALFPFTNFGNFIDVTPPSTDQGSVLSDYDTQIDKADFDPNDLPPAPRVPIVEEAIEPQPAIRDLSPYQGVDYVALYREAQIAPAKRQRTDSVEVERPVKRAKIVNRRTIRRLRPEEEDSHSRLVLRPRHTLHTPKRYRQ